MKSPHLPVPNAASLMGMNLSLPMTRRALEALLANGLITALEEDSVVQRAVDTLIWALIWIGVVGLGPFAGVLAIATADIGALAKLFSETIETADQKPVEGIRSTGGTGAQEFRYGVLPQVLPVIASQILYYFESNTRSATIITSGQSVTLATKLTQAGQPQVNRTVKLYRYLGGWKVVCTVRTNNLGNASCVQKPSVNADFYWGFGGDLGLLPQTSNWYSGPKVLTSSTDETLSSAGALAAARVTAPRPRSGSVRWGRSTSRSPGLLSRSWAEQTPGVRG